MENVELLKKSRNHLLSLHKSLVDFERARYEAFNGTVTSGQFLNVLLEDESLSWLRRFSTFIVDVDEMFAHQVDHVARSSRMQLIDENVGTIGSLNHRGLRIYLKQNRRDGIAAADNLSVDTFRGVDFSPSGTATPSSGAWQRKRRRILASIAPWPECP